MTRLRFLLLLTLTAGLVVPSTAAATKFEAGAYTASFSGTQEVESEFQFEGSKATCKTTNLTGSLAEASSSLTLHPTFSECSAFGFVGATIVTTGCDFVFHAGEEIAEHEFGGTADISCEAGKSITMSAGTCEVKIESQTGRSSMSYTNKPESSPENFRLAASLTKIKYTKVKDGFLCPLGGTGTAEDGTFTDRATMAATAKSEAVAAWLGPVVKLCKESQAKCPLKPVSQVYPKNTGLEGSAGNTLFFINTEVNKVKVELSVTCQTATLKGKNTKEEAARLPVTIEEMKFVNCTSGGGKVCKVENTGGAYAALVDRAAGVGNGTIEFTPEFTVDCEAADSIKCQVRAGVILPFTGGNPANIAAGGAVLNRIAGLNCPSVIEWTDTYTLSQPNGGKVFVTS
jgi:hypothetical protein